MKPLIHVLCPLVALAPLVARANLGDNELKIAEKYGQPAEEKKISDSMTARSYTYKELAVTVVFLNGTSQCEVFKKLDGSSLNDDQVQALLGDNSNNLIWSQANPPSGSRQEWIITGTVASASSSSDNLAVFAASPRHISTQGTRMVAVDVYNPNDSAPVQLAPPVLRRAICRSSAAGNVLAVFTSAYENVARRELPKNNPANDPATAK